jgi:hypothetical protein
VRKFIGVVKRSKLRYGRKATPADESESDHGAHQMDSSAGVKASNEMVTGRKDGKALV